MSQICHPTTTDQSSRRTFLFGLVSTIVIVTSIFGYRLATRGTNSLTLVSIDEAAWIYSSHYYHLAWLERDFQSEDWQHFDAYDHPPMMKYLVGAAMHLTGYTVTSLEPKVEWLKASSNPHEDRSDIIAQFHQTVPTNALFAARAVSTLSFIFACIFTYLIGQRTFSTLAGVAAACLMALSPLQQRIATEVFSDGLVMMLIAAMTWLQWHCARSLIDRQSKRLPWSVFALGMTLAMLVSTKLTGLAALPIVLAVVPLSIAIELRVKRRKNEPTPVSHVSIQHILLALACLIATGVLLAMFLNPLLLKQPISGLQKMIELRMNVVDSQAKMFFAFTMPTFPVKLAAFTLGCFRGGQGLGIGTLFFIVLGTCALPYYGRRDLLALSIFLGNFSGWLLATWLAFRLNDPRYLLPLAPFWALLAGAGVEVLATRLRYIASYAWPRLTIVLFALVLCIATLWSWDYFHIKRFAQRNPLWVPQAQSEADRAIEASLRRSESNIDWQNPGKATTAP